MERYTSVEDFITKNQHWQSELILLRETALSLELEEGLKWGFPVYMVNGKNVIGLGAFKSYVGVWFFHGALLHDKGKKLMNAQEGKTQAMRQWRFSSMDEIKDDLPLVETYIKEAIANQKAGKSISPSKGKPVVIPDELTNALKGNDLEAVFSGLSLSKRRDYAEYISEAKKEETKIRRLEKILPMIQDGVGLNDKYSKRS